MGLLDWLIGNNKESDDQSMNNSEAKYSIDIDSIKGDDISLTSIEYGGERYYCQASISPNEEYVVAYQDGSSGGR